MRITSIKNTQRGNTAVGIILIVALVWGVSSLFGGDGESDSDYTNNSSFSGYTSEDNDYEYYGESYPSGFSGTEAMEACNNSTGNCYDLDIDSDGENIERINFPNGGWRDVDYSDCEDGYCYVEDEDGTEWELQY